MQSEIISPALAVLLDIMTATNVDETQSVEAAKAIVEYEAPAGVFEMARRYLLSVAQDSEQSTRLRLEALSIMRKIEARRIVPGTTQGKDGDAVAALEARMAAGRERVALRARGEWPSARSAPEMQADEGDGLAAQLQRARLSRQLG